MALLNIHIVLQVLLMSAQLCLAVAVVLLASNSDAADNSPVRLPFMGIRGDLASLQLHSGGAALPAHAGLAALGYAQQSQRVPKQQDKRGQHALHGTTADHSLHGITNSQQQQQIGVRRARSASRRLATASGSNQMSAVITTGGPNALEGPHWSQPDPTDLDEHQAWLRRVYGLAALVGFAVEALALAAACMLQSCYQAVLVSCEEERG